MIRALNDTVIVKSDFQEGYVKTEGGIILDKAKDQILVKVLYGTVETVGPKCIDLKPGDRISFDRKSVITNFKHDDNYFYLLKESEVMGICE